MPLNRFDTMSSLSDSSAQRLAKSINGRSGRMGKSLSGIKRSYLQDGKGAEVPAVMEGVLAPLYKSLKVNNAALVDAEERQHEIWKGRNVDMDFAFKMALDTSDMYRQGTYDDAKAPTRFVCGNVFRHYDPTVLDPAVTGGYSGTATADWNKTLGPDSSFVRKIVPAGTAAQPVIAGLSDKLYSPYRYPKNLDFMMARYNQTLLENTSWNLNPQKFKYFTDNPLDPPAWGGSLIETPQPVYVWGQAPITGYKAVGGGGSAASAYPCTSYPSMQSNISTSIPTFDENGRIKQRYAKDGIYKVQFNKGSISYNFNNEASGASIVDVVVLGFKKGTKIPGGKLMNQQFFDSMENGYRTASLGTLGAGILDGKRNSATGGYADAKNEFLPDLCFKVGKGQTDSFIDGSANATKTHPYKVLGRDQFTIGGGQSRAYKIGLPSLNYDARDYRNNDSTTGAEDNQDWKCYMDMTILVLIGACSAFNPQLELNSTTSRNSAVIDYNANNVLMSVTGTYSEQPHPCYYVPAQRGAWINGVLERPVYDIEAGDPLPKVKPIDIANADQIAPSGATTTTVEGSYSLLGTINGVPGASGA